MTASVPCYSETWFLTYFHSVFCPSISLFWAVAVLEISYLISLWVSFQWKIGSDLILILFQFILVKRCVNQLCFFPFNFAFFGVFFVFFWGLFADSFFKTLPLLPTVLHIFLNQGMSIFVVFFPFNFAFLGFLIFYCASLGMYY